MTTGRFAQRGWAFQAWAFRTWGLAGADGSVPEPAVSKTGVDVPFRTRCVAVNSRARLSVVPEKTRTVKVE